MKLVTITTLFFAFLSLNSMANDNLMPEITHASDSMQTYSTPDASLGRTATPEELKEHKIAKADADTSKEESAEKKL